MATKLFLNPDEREQALSILSPPQLIVDGNEKKEPQFPNQKLSDWLSTKMVERFKSVSGWEKAEPLILGSWARGELCPKSDFDVLFVGDLEKTKEVVQELNQKGLKLRHRYPEDLDDWTKGVEPFDILALRQAKALTPGSESKVAEQKQKVAKSISKWRGQFLKAMRQERLERAKRHDSIANYLEPNIKYGAGGLRDLDQALQVLSLFPEKFSNIDHALNVLNYYKKFFLSVRQKLHLLGGSDVLTADLQGEISQWLGFKDRTAFMGQVELGVSRVSFYTDWVLETARTREKLIEQVNKFPIESLEDAFTALRKKPILLMQYRVRRALDDLFLQKQKISLVGTLLQKHIRIDQPEEFFVSLFRARLIDRVIPKLKNIFGLVQHDQYHRFSVDAHILQALKVTARLYLRPRVLEGVAKLVNNFNDFDWQVMLWSCLYHDAAKGSGKPHETEGARYVLEDFKAWGLPQKLADEVSWIVDKHLILSRTAFRKNLRSPKTWAELSEHGAVGERLIRLAVFTAIDIKATNPEAWNSWKAGLMTDLVSLMQKSEAESYIKFLKYSEKRKLKLDSEFSEALDPALTKVLSAKVLLDDYRDLKNEKGDLAARVVTLPGQKKRLWVRFHRRVDRPGIFLEFVEKIFAAGASIQHAYVQTLPTYGAYDWFEVKTGNPAQFKKILALNTKPKDVPKVKFDSLEVVSSDENETVISFRGLDQVGLLVNAARALTDAGLTIRWARVLTWGRQIDDLFGVATPSGLTSKEVLTRVEKLVARYS